MLGSIVLFIFTNFLLRGKLVHSNSLCFLTVLSQLLLLKAPATQYLPPLAFSFTLSIILYPKLCQRIHVAMSCHVMSCFYCENLTTVCQVKLVPLSALVKSSSFTLDITNFGILHFKGYFLLLHRNKFASLAL